MSEKPTVVRGPVLTYMGDPFKDGLEHTMVYEPDAIVAMANGRITHFGPTDKIRPQLPAGTEIKNYGKDSLISAGFIDSHVHFPQTPMVAAYGEQLLDWLNKYTFPTEQKYADKEFARSVAKVFLREPAQRHHLRMHLLHRLPAIGGCPVRGSGARSVAGRRQGDDGPQCRKSCSTRPRRVTMTPSP